MRGKDYGFTEFIESVGLVGFMGFVEFNGLVKRRVRRKKQKAVSVNDPTSRIRRCRGPKLYWMLVKVFIDIGVPRNYERLQKNTQVLLKLVR